MPLFILFCVFLLDWIFDDFGEASFKSPLVLDMSVLIPDVRI